LHNPYLSKDDGLFSVPRLPGWSFQQCIHGGVLPPPHCPDKSGPAGSPTDTSSKKSIVFLGIMKIARFFKGLEELHVRLSITVLFYISLMLLTFFLEKGVRKENNYGIHPENMKLYTHSSLKTDPKMFKLQQHMFYLMNTAFSLPLLLTKEALSIMSWLWTKKYFTPHITR